MQQTHAYNAEHSVVLLSIIRYFQQDSFNKWLIEDQQCLS